MTSFRTNQYNAQQERMIRKKEPPNFLDTLHEWRRLFAETWGTFLLVLVAAGGGVVAAKSGGAVTLGITVIAPGLMVMAIIYFMCIVSGAHLNPAVTLAFAVRHNFSENGARQLFNIRDVVVNQTSKQTVQKSRIFYYLVTGGFCRKVAWYIFLAPVMECLPITL